MNLLTNDDLELLAHHREEPCVSVFAPLRRGGPEKKQNTIRLKNMFREVEKQLDEAGLRHKEQQQLLEPARGLMDGMHVWKQDSDGLAVFISPELFRYYRLPAHFQELAVVSDQFHIKPLLPLLTGDGRFYVLALSQKEVRFLQCTHHSLRELELRGVPTSLQEALKFDYDEEHLQFHSGVPARGRRGGAVFHAQADDSDRAVHKKNVRMFLEQLESGVSEMLSGQKAPLVLAGVPEIRALYREVNHYGNLVEDGIDGSPDRVKSEELQQKAWEIVQPRFEQAKEQAVAAYRRFAGTDRASDDLNEVLEAAAQGRVEVLLTDLDRHEWGRFDPERGFIYLHYRQEGGDEDLLDWAAVHTLLHGGTVFALQTDQMPDGAEVGAVYRY